VKYILWTLQIVLTLLFLFAGGVKLVTSSADLAKQMAGMPVPFIRFVGVCEVLGGLGLVLPGLLKIQTWLTPLAAAGLAIIMIGATAVTMPMGAMALFPFFTGCLLVYVGYVRWKIAPLG
jgi:uncharacterized membrane protein YphA (DoxX/SURF4 family)